jgi:hypothetical protein
MSSSSTLPRPYLTPACKVGADRWPELHLQCRAPGYQHRTLGYTSVQCGCRCHQADRREGAT